MNEITTILNNTFLTFGERKEALTVIGKSYTTETLKSAIAQSALNKSQIKAILSANGLQGEILETTADELANVVSTNAVAASQKSATASTLGFGSALKGLRISLRNLIAAHPLLTAITAIGGAIFGVVKAIDFFTVSLAEQHEKTKDLQNELSEIQSDISDVNSELQTTADRIDELNSKDALSFVEQEELDILIAQNKELERRNMLLAEQEATKQQEVAESVQKEFDKEYGNKRYSKIFSQQQIDEINQKRARYEELYINTGYNSEEEIAELEQLKQELEEWDSYDSSSSFTEHIQETINAYDALKQKKKENEELSKQEEDELAEYRKQLADFALDLDDYIDRYGIDNETSQSWKGLSDSIYECLYPSGYLTEKFDEVFNSLSKNVQTELKQLAQEGSLSVDNLSDDIINKFSEAGFSAKEVVEQIYSTLEDLGNAFANETPVYLSISETVDQLNTQLKPAMDSLKSAWHDIFTDDGFALNSIDILSTCDSIKSKLDDMSKLGLTVDYSAFEDLVRVLNNTESTEKNVEDAFDTLAASITQAGLSGTEDFETMKAALGDLGIINNEMAAFNALASNAEMLDEALSQANVSMDDFIVNTEDGSVEATKAGQAFLEEKVGAENCAEALSILAFYKELCNLQGMNTAGEVASLRTLAENAGYTGEVIQYLIELEEIYQKIDNGFYNKNNEELAVLKERAKVLTQQITESTSKISYEPKVDFSSVTKSASKAGSSSGKEAGDAYADAFEEELKELDDLHSNSLISEKEYLDRLRVLYERYFKDKLGYEKEFADYQKKYLDGYKSLYESVFSHASKVISDRIDAINDEKDSAIDSLEAQKKAAEDSYNAQIKLLEDKKDALQAEIDKIKEANEDRKEAIDLQKAEYELARMQNQRTILQYSEDKGVHYVTDTSGIRDARNDLDDKKADAQIRALEKQQDALDKQIDAIQEMLDASNEYWDTQIEQTEKYYDAMIQGMEEYRSRWEELSDLQEQAEMIALLEELGYTEEDLADAGSGAFEALRTSYLGILKDMNDGNQSVLDGLSQLANIDMSSIPSFLGATQGYIDSIANMDVAALSDGLNNVCDGFSNIADSAASAASAISGNGNVSARSNNQSSDNPPSGGTGNNPSLKDAITEASKGSVEEINKISDAFAGENEEGTSVTGAIQKVTDKIGNTDSDKDGSDSLMPTLAEQTKAALDEENGIPAQTDAWGELNEPLGESVDLVTTLQSTLEDMDGRTFTVTLNVDSNGSPNSIVSEFSGGVSNSPGHGGDWKTRARVQGTNDEGWITLPNGLLARPLQEGDKGWDLAQKFQPLADRILNGETDIMSNAMIENQRQMKQMAGDITTMNVTTNSKPSVTIGDIHVTCPGVTSKEVAKQVGVELNNMFSGLHLDAM